MSTAFAGLAARSPYESAVLIAGGSPSGDVLPCLGKEWVVAQVEGTSPSVAVEGTVDGNTWYPLLLTNMTTGTAASTITAAGLYQVRVAGLVAVRVSETSSADTVIACAV